jgi:hypothetical protein
VKVLPDTINFRHIDFYSPDILISGNGRKKVKCGKFVKIGIDRNTGQNKIVLSTCGKQGCPNCFKAWANLVAKKSSARLMALSKHKKVPLHHVAFTPKQEGFSMELLRRHKAKLKRFLFDMSQTSDVGYSVVVHPYAFKSLCPTCDEWTSIPDKKLKNGVSENTCLHCGTKYQWRQYRAEWRKHLHYHLITNAYIDVSSEEFKKYAKENEFLYSYFHTIGRKDGKWLTYKERREDLHRTLEYELGHAYFNSTKTTHALVHCGMFNSKNYTVEETKIITPTEYQVLQQYEIETRVFGNLVQSGEKYFEIEYKADMVKVIVHKEVFTDNFLSKIDWSYKFSEPKNGVRSTYKKVHVKRRKFHTLDSLLKKHEKEKQEKVDLDLIDWIEN